MNFKSELTVLISQYYKEFPSNTPDYVLAEYMVGCLRVFNKTVKQREAYYGNESKVDTTTPTTSSCI